MRFIPNQDLYKRANAYIGKNVRTTSEREGVVRNAFLYKGVVTLYCETPDGRTFTTDNEHASIWMPRNEL